MRLRTTIWSGLLLACYLQAQENPRWLPHYTRDGGGFETLIHLINTDFETALVVTLLPYAADGTLLNVVREVTIDPGHQLEIDRVFLNWQGQPVSHVQVEGPEAVRVAGAYRALADGAMPAGVPAVAEPSAMIRFVPVSGAAWFDGVVATNPNDTAATLTFSAHDTSGNTVRTVRAEVPAGGKWLDVLANLFAETPDEGYVEIRAEPAVLFLVLRGSLGGVELPVLTQVQADTFASSPAPLSYNNQIGRIFNRKCSFCHHFGGIGPFPTTAYEWVTPMKYFISENVEAGIMPPWLAAPDCGKFADSQALDPAEKDMILDWVREGAIEGPPERAPEPPAYEDGDWQAGVPDLVMKYQEAFDFQPGPDVYRCFPMALNNPEPLQVRGVEILPGNLEIVHHVLVFVDDGDEGFALDAAEDDAPGYTCFGGPRTGTIRLLGGWAPGSVPTFFPDDVAITLPPNATLIVQVHYHFSNATAPDQTRIGLHLADEPRSLELLWLPMVDQEFVIPAGAKDYLVSREFSLPFFVSLDLYFITPHMHLLGQTISAEATFPDGSQMCLVDVPRWDFEWQRFYQYDQPIHLPGGTTLSMRCTYDNSADNPHNPNHPPKDVGWGEATTDEMALVFFGIVTPFNITKEGLNQPEWWPDSL